MTKDHIAVLENICIIHDAHDVQFHKDTLGKTEVLD